MLMNDSLLVRGLNPCGVHSDARAFTPPEESDITP